MIVLIVFLFVVTAVTVVPVMLAAGLVGARNTGFGAALFAVLLHAGFAMVADRLLGPSLLTLLLRLFGGAAVYAFALETTVWRGFAVSVLAVAIAWLLALGALLMFGMPFAMW